MVAYFNRFSITMTKYEARVMSHRGQCYPDVAHYASLPKFKRQLAKIATEDLAKELKEYCCWDTEELANNEENQKRILWIAAGMIVEGVK